MYKDLRHVSSPPRGRHAGAIVLIVIGFNFIGDGLRDSFDARLRRR
ncbi:hypothetical protein ABGB18_08560 [Nonomuraea sp. B12E4]